MEGMKGTPEVAGFKYRIEDGKYMVYYSYWEDTGTPNMEAEFIREDGVLHLKQIRSL